MPDLLTHALGAYTLATLISRRYAWLTPQYVTVAMAGAFIPNLTKIDLVLPSERVEALLGVPFDWLGLHTLGGAVVSVAIGVVLMGSEHRRRVAALLGLCAGSHLLADALLKKAPGHSYHVFWPLSAVEPPTPGLYLSTDPQPTIVMAVVAGVVYVATRRRGE
jgi:hypothetical protein